ncbi:MAG: hypothetical protein ACTSX6_04580 [Candidatus Heimdallarchaeaceae archaeon]
MNQDIVVLNPEQIVKPDLVVSLRQLTKEYVFQFVNSNSDKFMRAYIKTINNQRVQLHIKYGKTREAVFVLRTATDSEKEYNEKTNVIGGGNNEK